MPKENSFLIDNFNESGSLQTSKPKIHSRLGRSGNVIGAVAADVKQNPRISYRRRGQWFGIFKTTLYNIVKIGLLLPPYKM